MTTAEHFWTIVSLIAGLIVIILGGLRYLFILTIKASANWQKATDKLEEINGDLVELSEDLKQIAANKDTEHKRIENRIDRLEERQWRLTKKVEDANGN